MTGISQSEAKRLILDAIINPLHQFINGETERNQVNWLEINGLSRHFSEQKMFRRVTGTGTIDPPVPLTVLHAVYG